jgi:RNA polymerase sigma factor (sigma-70 family)
MKSTDLNQRLSQISTVWSVVRQAHEGSPEEMTAAQTRLLEHYGEAVHRYLLRAVGDPSAADDLTQEFALSILRGKFHRADPVHGRFRNYVKTALFHLVSSYRKRRQRHPRVLAQDNPALADLASPPDSASSEFDEDWRQTLLARAWRKLAETKPVYHAVLHLRASNPNLSSIEMAEHLTAQLGKSVTAESVRQSLRRARAAFAELLIEEVARSLDSPSKEQVEHELADLRLLACCRSVLDRERPSEA